LRMRAPSNINTLHQQVRHRNARPHHSRHPIEAISILPQIRRARPRYHLQRRRPRPGANRGIYSAPVRSASGFHCTRHTPLATGDRWWRL
jgi:hypothetical protein